MQKPVSLLFCLITITLSLWARSSYALTTSGVDTNTVGGLSVSTVPADADVFVDGKMMGRTPVQLSRVPAGFRLLRIAKTGFCDIADSVIILEGSTITRSIQLDSACGLIVRSVPDSAAIYVENIFVGRSPLRIPNLRGGWKSIKVMKVNSAPWEDHVYLAPGASVTVDAKLKSKFGSLSLEVFSDDVEILVDGKTAAKGSLVDYMIPGGTHDIGARTSDGSESVTETVYILPGESVRWQARFGQHSMKAFFISMGLPGLGQMLNGSPGKGLVIMGGFAAAGVFTFVTHMLYQGDVSQFNDALALYRKATNEDAAKSAGDNLSARYETLHSAYKLRTAGWVTVGIIYVYNLVDAFLNHSTVNTMSQTAMGTTIRMGPEVVVSPGGSKLTFRIVF
jgi:archaellum component FlaF (FlaF/FlaG flagellin family)